MTQGHEPNSKNIGLPYYAKLAIDTVRLNRRAMAVAAGDSGALRFGLVATALGGGFSVLFYTGWEGVVLFSLFSVGSIFLFSAFVHLFAGYTKGKTEFVGFMRIVALSGIIDWLAVIPFAALIVTLWSIAIAVVGVQEVYGLNKGRAVFCVMMAACALWIITLILFSGPLGQWYGVPGG
jgi:hypothetical protein